MKRLTLILLLVACKKESAPAPAAIGDAARGRQIVQQYGCVSCHDIPTISGARGMLGPPLTQFASRQLIARTFPNTPENVVKYLQNPQAVDPANVMPNFGLTADQSRDIAAFLYTLK